MTILNLRIPIRNFFLPSFTLPHFIVMKPVCSQKSWVLVQMLSGLPLTPGKNEGNRRWSSPFLLAEKQNLKCNSLKRASSQNFAFLFSSAKKWICNSEWFLSKIHENECVINCLTFISFFFRWPMVLARETWKKTVLNISS